MSYSSDKVKKKLYEYLSGLTLNGLRGVARQIGVEKPTEGRKDLLISRTISVYIGEISPVERTKRGAPIKEEEPDPKHLKEMERIVKECEESEDNLMQVNAPVSKQKGGYYEQPIYQGVLELLPNGCGYVRTNGFRASSDDIFVSMQSVREQELREGDYVVCHAIQSKGSNAPSLTRVLSVNQQPNEKSRINLNSLSVTYPERAIRFSAIAGKSDLRV
ncbi:MAG: hypothetical protein J6Z36_03730, partial [Clostridia bacterium]|nr:hypothetical protein [Clostridia bacterium]